jgi:hypothetical protein
VRPYVLTGGRVPADGDVRLDTLVHAGDDRGDAPLSGAARRLIEEARQHRKESLAQG